MATHTLTTDRRSFLVAAPIIAAAVAIPTLAIASPARPWDLAMQRLRDTDAACKAYDVNVFSPYFNREMAFEASHGVVHAKRGYFDARKALAAKYPGYQTPNHIHDEYERLTDIYCEAEDALMQMPAPDLPALRWKLDRIVEPDGTDTTPAWSRSYVAQTTKDYQRLLGDA